MIIFIILLLALGFGLIQAAKTRELEAHYEAMENKESNVSQEVTKNIQVNNTYTGDNLTVKESFKSDQE